MDIFNKIIKRIVYLCTEKPTHYVHVDNPKTLQEHRQIQYNNWCKAKGVYNGSYLPKNPDILNHRWWVDITSVKNKRTIKHYKRKPTGQIVRFDPEDENQIDHYHWYNPNPTIPKHKLKTLYLDRYGKPCTERDNSHHLAPLDKDCPKKALKRYLKWEKH